MKVDNICLSKPFDSDLKTYYKQTQVTPNFGSKSNICLQQLHTLAGIKSEFLLKLKHSKIGLALRKAFINKRIKKALSNKPVFGTYHSMGEKSIKHVNMGNYLTVNATENEGYIGTNGLGPCIGLSIVNKKDGKPINMSLAHISALIDLHTLERLFYAMKEPSELDITLISAGNETKFARKILYELLTSDIGNKIKNISVNLTCSKMKGPKCAADFAVNTKTGELYTDLPFQDFDLDRNRERFYFDCLEKSSHQTIGDCEGIFDKKYDPYV